MNDYNCIHQRKGYKIKEFNFVTHCDSHYLSRATALRNSIGEHSKNCNLFLVCHDTKTLLDAQKSGFDRKKLIELERIIEIYPELLVAKGNRSHLEFLFCLTPFILRYAIEILKLEEIVYIDADKFIYGKPESLFSEVRDSNFAITSHNFLPDLRPLNAYGKFNVGVLFARRAEESLKILNWWSDMCIQSTSINRNDPEIFGDQKYLDSFSYLYPEICIYEDLGINSAPWNCKEISVRDEKLFRDDRNTPLVTFHFSGVRFNRFFFITGYNRYGLTPTKAIKRNLYKPYIKILIALEKELTRNNYHKFNMREIVRGIYFKDLSFIFKL